MLFMISREAFLGKQIQIRSAGGDEMWFSPNRLESGSAFLARMVYWMSERDREYQEVREEEKKRQEADDHLKKLVREVLAEKKSVRGK